ncbi:putative ATP-dependent RNA helicase DHX40 [Acipenser ruthenus]|uniref:RNA helicase n=1 Tax=Acipenser ruthenus TaxID=7906 RepID=A0A662YMF7_ACIRT|nr:putative ATP-dependent RNA helicase DHX40 [Acipenser ruthenus]
MEKKNKSFKTKEGSATDTVPPLPIHKHRDRLIRAVKENPFLIVTGETGSGKTTQLPQYLYQAGFGKGTVIGVTQPRRVAAISVAQRVSEEMGCPLGREVGYQVRFDDCTSKDTAIKYMTDGCLLREILTDASLSRYSVVILDEAHERSLNTDILFGLLKKLFQKKQRGDGQAPLKVVVMSATLEMEKLSEFLEDCPVCTIPGRTYPVTEIFCNLIGPKDRESSVYVKEVVKVALDIHTNEPAGDILVFLTGQAEIEKACDALYEKAESIDYRYDIEDRYIVDSGFVKQLNHNSRVGLDILEVVPISKTEAKQRAGRAGRTCAGKCFRIYSREFWEKCMPEYTIPEIQRTSLTSVILTLKCLGVHDVIRFPYLDSPEERFILEALKQLYQCDAIDRRGHVTRLGQFMVEFPLPPGLTRALLKAAALGSEDILLPIAAMLSVENVFIRPGQPEKQQKAEEKHRELAAEMGGCNDFTTLLNIFQKCKASDSPVSWCQDHWIHWRAIKSAFSVETQLQEILARLKQLSDFPVEKFEGSQNEMLRQCLCLGYFSNVARRSVGRTFCTMDGHGSIVHIHPSSAIYVRTVCPIRYEWVKDLLPKLHEIDVYELSSVAREEVTEEEVAKWEIKETAKRQKDHDTRCTAIL